MRTTLAAAVLLALGLGAQPAMAGEAWDEIRTTLWGERPVAEADAALKLTAPYRATDDREVPMAAEVRFADGRKVQRLWLILDENPMPVSAVFDLAEPQQAFSALVSMRLNGPSPVRAVVEDDHGGLTMAETFVKTSGLGACAAPPVADPAIALESIGEMSLAAATLETSPTERLAALGAGDPTPNRIRLEMKHPSHSGLQMDQITLLYLPARFVETVEVWQDDQPMFTMTGSISLSEDPEVEFGHDPDAGVLKVRMTDTDGTSWQQVFPLGAS